MVEPLMLEGNVDTRDVEIERLTRELMAARGEAAQAKASILALRRQLGPLHAALKAVFGEIDAAVDQEYVSGPAQSAPPRARAVWESWKRKLGGKAAAFIDALLEHGEMTAPQLRVAAHCGQRTVYDMIFKLNKLGLINKNGGRYSLKQL